MLTLDGLFLIAVHKDGVLTQYKEDVFTSLYDAAHALDMVAPIDRPNGAHVVTVAEFIGAGGVVFQEPVDEDEIDYYHMLDVEGDIRNESRD